MKIFGLSACLYLTWGDTDFGVYSLFCIYSCKGNGNETTLLFI